MATDNNLKVIFNKNTTYDKSSGQLQVNLCNDSSIGKTGFDILPNSQISLLNLLAPHQFNFVKYKQNLKDFSNIVKLIKFIDKSKFPGTQFDSSVILNVKFAICPVHMSGGINNDINEGGTFYDVGYRFSVNLPLSYPNRLVLKIMDYLDDGNIWRNKDIFHIPASLTKYALKFGTETITNKLETSTTKDDMFALCLLDTEPKPRFRFFMTTIARSIDCYKARLAINDFIFPPQNGFPDW